MATARLVIVVGSCVGIGKSTFTRALVDELGRCGHDALLVPEVDVLNDPALVSLAAGFQTRTYPTSEAILEHLERKFADLPAVDFVVDDGCWLLLAEDLPWAQSSWQDFVDFTHSLLTLARRLDPIVLFLEVSASEAALRRVGRDGRDAHASWLRAMRRLPALERWRGDSDENLLTAWAERLRGVWTDAGACLVVVTGEGSTQDAVAEVLPLLLSDHTN